MPASQTLLFPDPRPLVERLGQDFFRQLTKRPGVYLMHDTAGQVLYVGKAKNLRQRLGHYRVANPDRLGRRHLRLLRQVARIELQECTDECAALAREAELLRLYRPKFNRAGVWPGTPRFLVWRRVERALEFAISREPSPGWQPFGPFGSGVVFLRSALVRLLWYAAHPGAGLNALPHGWLHGAMGAIAAIPDADGLDCELETGLTNLLAGDADGFVAWVSQRTESGAQAWDSAIRDADLETVVGFMEAKARRTLSFSTPDSSSADQGTQPALLEFSFLDRGAGQP